MNKNFYQNLKLHLENIGYKKEFDFIEERLSDNFKLTKKIFLYEYIFVVCNSGMRAQVAQKIYNVICQSMNTGVDISNVFRHQKKVEAIKYTVANINELFNGYLKSKEKLNYLQTLKHIGPIVKYHLARNIGFNCVKPDRHLVRIARQYKTTPDKMCEKLSRETGDKVGVIDCVIWRAANLGLA